MANGARLCKKADGKRRLRRGGGTAFSPSHFECDSRPDAHLRRRRNLFVMQTALLVGERLGAASSSSSNARYGYLLQTEDVWMFVPGYDQGKVKRTKRKVVGWGFHWIRLVIIQSLLSLVGIFDFLSLSPFLPSSFFFSLFCSFLLLVAISVQSLLVQAVTSRTHTRPFSNPETAQLEYISHKWDIPTGSMKEK